MFLKLFCLASCCVETRINQSWIDIYWLIPQTIWDRDGLFSSNITHFLSISFKRQAQYETSFRQVFKRACSLLNSSKIDANTNGGNVLIALSLHILHSCICIYICQCFVFVFVSSLLILYHLIGYFVFVFVVVSSLYLLTICICVCYNYWCILYRCCWCDAGTWEICGQSASPPCRPRTNGKVKRYHLREETNIAKVKV